MGGFGATSIALRHPDLYGSLVSIAGYFHLDDPDGVFDSDPADHDPDELTTAAGLLHVLLADGDADDEPVVQGEAQRYAAKLNSLGVPAELTLVPGAHDYQLVHDLLPYVTRFLDESWAHPTE
jgi:S-formylglutathione hydrolase FrmB